MPEPSCELLEKVCPRCGVSFGVRSCIVNDPKESGPATWHCPECGQAILLEASLSTNFRETVGDMAYAPPDLHVQECPARCP